MTESNNNIKRLTFAGLTLILLCAIALVGIFAFSILTRSGEPANLITAKQVTQKFLESIHGGDIGLAHLMLSENFSPSISVEQFAELVHQDEEIFSAYESWEICDWGLFVGDGYVIDTSGLLYYGNRKIVTQISLHKDSDSVWRIQGFRFRSDVEPVEFGLCK